MIRRIVKFAWSHSELITWITALVILFVAVPEQAHFTLCPIYNLGFDFCPGCGGNEKRCMATPLYFHDTLLLGGGESLNFGFLLEDFEAPDS